MALNFPAKIYQILENESADIIRWHSNGHAFRIVDHDRFEREIIPKYFRHNQMSSVQRQLNLYGFKCINRGEDKGAFFHPRFRRGDWEVVKTITRFSPNKKQSSDSETHGTKSETSSTSEDRSSVDRKVQSCQHEQPTPIAVAEPAAEAMHSSFELPFFDSHAFQTGHEPMDWQHWGFSAFPVVAMNEQAMVKATSFDRMMCDLDEVGVHHKQPLVPVEPDDCNHSAVKQEGPQEMVVKAYPRNDALIKKEAISSFHSGLNSAEEFSYNRPFVYVINDSITIDPDFDLSSEVALFSELDLTPPSKLFAPPAVTRKVNAVVRDAAINTFMEPQVKAGFVCNQCNHSFAQK